MQAFPAAFMLDPAIAICADGKVKPPWGSLWESDKSGVKDLVRRFAGPRKQSAATEELLRFIGEGYADKDFAENIYVESLKLRACKQLQTGMSALLMCIALKTRVAGKDGKLVLKGSEIRRSMWSGSMTTKFPILSKIADTLLSMHATSCGSERKWSVWRSTCHDNRRRLALDKVHASSHAFPG